MVGNGMVTMAITMGTIMEILMVILIVGVTTEVIAIALLFT